MATSTRAQTYAEDFVAAHRRFIDLIESIGEDAWRLTGGNYPERLNDEDESRSIAVIAHHVADSEEFIIGRIEMMLAGKRLAPVDFHESNARQAVDKAGVTKDEVLAQLRANEARIAARIRAIPDDALDVPHETPVGPATAAQRIERVLIGHLKMHQGSIEAALS